MPNRTCEDVICEEVKWDGYLGIVKNTTSEASGCEKHHTESREWIWNEWNSLFTPQMHIQIESNVILKCDRWVQHFNFSVHSPLKVFLFFFLLSVLEFVFKLKWLYFHSQFFPPIQLWHFISELHVDCKGKLECVWKFSSTKIPFEWNSETRHMHLWY